MRFLKLGALAALLTAPLAAHAAEHATATFLDTKGQPVGKASLTEGPRGLLLKVEISGLAPGPHGIHFHSVGTCEDWAAGFKDSKGHVKSGEVEHGLLNPKGDEAGDLPNIYAGADGKAEAEIYTTAVSLGAAEGRVDLLDTDGTAIVVHAGGDDLMTQPIGGAGARVACGVIKAGM